MQEWGFVYFLYNQGKFQRMRWWGLNTMFTYSICIDNFIFCKSWRNRCKRRVKAYFQVKSIVNLEGFYFRCFELK